MMANIQLSVYVLLAAACSVFIAMYVWVDRLLDPAAHTDWWTVFVAAMPCFNCQATLEARKIVTRRVIFVFIGIYVLLTNSFYQTYLLRSLILSKRVTPMTMKQIIAGVERHEYTIMFYNQEEPVEQWIRPDWQY
jgi:drug/metabolite transporter (DMT)-like permease